MRRGALFPVLALLAAGCGDETSALEESFCPTYVEIVETKQQVVPGESPEEIRERYRRILRLAEELEAEASLDVRNEVTELVETAHGVIDSADVARWENYWQGATNVIDHYVKVNCDITVDG